MDELLQSIAQMNQDIEIQEQKQENLEENLQQSIYILQDALSLEERFREELIRDEEDDQIVQKRGG